MHGCESWIIKKAKYLRTVAVAFELWCRNPLDGKIKSLNPKGNQSWIFIGRTDAEAEAPILWPPDAKNSLLRKDPDAGNDWGQEEKGTTEDEMVGWHHRLNGHESEQAPGVGDGQGGLACCCPRGRRLGHDGVTERNRASVLSCFSRVQLFATPWTAALLCPWGYPSRNTRVGFHFFLQGIFLTQGSNPCLQRLLHWQVIFPYIWFKLLKQN